jgi:hypothetical protein
VCGRERICGHTRFSDCGKGVVSAWELDVSERVVLRGRWLGFGWCVRAERKLKGPDLRG